MIYVAVGLCLFITAVGAVGVVSPSALFAILGVFRTRAGLLVVSAFRLVFGLLLLLLAADSAAPGFLRVFGGLAVLSGVATPFVGVERSGRVVDWWTARPGWFVRLWAAVATALGLFLVWALVGWALLD